MGRKANGWAFVDGGEILTLGAFVELCSPFRKSVGGASLYQKTPSCPLFICHVAHFELEFTMLRLATPRSRLTALPSLPVGWAPREISSGSEKDSIWFKGGASMRT
jgi:hypothetical protein